MSSPENQEHHRSPPSPPPPPKPLTSKLFSLFSVLVLLSAISYGIITQTNHYKIPFLKSIIFPQPNILQKLQTFLNTIPIRTPNPTPSNTIPKPSHCVLWMAPFLSGGGYSSESWSYILSLHEYTKHHKSPRFRLRIEQHGDLESIEFWEGLSLEMRNLAFELHQTQCTLDETIVICHSEPGAWYPPLFETLPCPPIGYGHFKAVIGRTMFETDRVTAEHVDRCNNMDYVWVPTEFHVETFTKSGVDPLKVVKVVQAVDVEFFDPAKYEPLDIGARGSLVLGKPNSGKEFVFLSVFKWENRKGWDVLLRSYLREFNKDDSVALFLLTNPYHTDIHFGNRIIEYVKNSDLEEPYCGWAPIYVIDDHIPQVDLPRLYKAADAFILPSRGEGWGRPIVEAMAMSLPVISTNWSGQTEYMTEENSYPLSVDTFSEVTEGPFKGHLWAEPSIDKLQMLMRHVMSNYEEAKAKGKQARVDMISKFSPELVAQIVADRIHHIIDHADEEFK